MPRYFKRNIQFCGTILHRAERSGASESRVLPTRFVVLERPRVEPWEDTVHLGWWPCAIVQNLSFHLAATLPGCPVFHYCARPGGDPGPGTDPFAACGQCMSLLFLPSAADSFCAPLSDL